MRNSIDQYKAQKGEIPADLNNESQSTVEAVTKATLELSNLSTNGGLLSEEQSSSFTRTMIDQPTLLNSVREVVMTSPKQEVNKIEIGSRMLKAASQTLGSRSLSEADRTAPTTSKVTLDTKEVIAEIALPYEVLEDNIERGGLQNTILDLIAERAALDLEELLINGDTASADSFLALQDGILKLSTSNIVNAANTGINAQLISNLTKAMPTKFRRNKNLMRLFVSHDIEQDYRQRLSTRGTDLGDAVLTGSASVPVFGIPMVGVANMPDSSVILTNPQNILMGIQRNIRIESERDIYNRTFRIVLTARVAINIEEELAIAKMTNLVTQ